MKVTRRKFVFALCALAIGCAVVPREAQAQIITQDIFSPANYAMYGKIWASDLTNLQKWELELAQGLKTYNNAVQIYGMASQEASYLKNKQILMAVGFLAQHAIIPGQPGWDKALTAAGKIASAGAVWQQMAAPGSSLQSRIAMSDSFATSAINSIGSCNQAANTNGASLGSLEQMASDLSPGANTRANQANISNMSQTQQLRVAQCQQNLQSQIAKLQLVQIQNQRSQDQYLLDKQTSQTAVMGQMQVTNTASSITGFVDR